ncbi:DUF1365 domain-containing protein [Verrucomicrobiaceae bacterium 227]
MNSCLYECDVMHRRIKPMQKRFDYRVFMLKVDLDDLPKVPCLGLNRFNLFSLQNRDHVDLGHPGGIKANLFAWLTEQSIAFPPDARVELVTLPRVLGYSFNPVSFFYLSNPDGTPLFAVAEVVNTYREMKLYLVNKKQENAWQGTVPKEFYVSPFSDVRDSFDFNLGLPGDKLAVKINNLNEGEISLVSAIQGRARPLTASRLLWFAIKYPLLTFKIIIMIHWQALKLWIRKVPYFPKATRPESQTNVLRPHSTHTKSHEHPNPPH